MSRLVNVSNRVPVPKGANPPGGLGVGVLAAMRGRGGLWFGWNGESAPEEAQGPELVVREGITFATIPLPQSMCERYYSGFSNGTLWPLFHCFIGGLRYEDGEYAAYLQANELLARVLVPLLRPADLIWVHDYHLIPLGDKLRRQEVCQPIGFFLHVPFPHFEVLRALPKCAELLRELLAYDLIGVQTEADRQSLLGAMRATYGAAAVDADGTITVDARVVHTGVFPIGVDVPAVSQAAAKASASSSVQRMMRSLVGRRLIIGVDRLDYSKGLLERFQAYRQFLEDYPDQMRQVTYMQIAPLGRQNVQAYAQIRDALERSAGRINGSFADADWTPIRYLNRNVPHSTLMGFLRAARVCLVTPLRDGMNLVAKEFVAAQDAADPGVLVLSDRAGAACELTDALLVNPYHGRAISRAMHAALTMPLPERQARHEKLVATLREHGIHRWQQSFLEQLQAAGTARENNGGALLAAVARTARPDAWC